MEDRFKFLTAFVRRPFETGSVTPSSPHLAAAMIEGTNLHEANTVVEFGGGTGPFTGVIQKNLRPGAVFLSFEINPDFAEPLQARFPDVRVVKDSVVNLRHHLKAAGRDSVDVIVSGLPWAAFKEERQQAFLDAAVSDLCPGGRFTTFAYSYAAWLPPGRRFRDLLEARFSEVATSPVVWRNFPPAFVYRCRK